MWHNPEAVGSAAAKGADLLCVTQQPHHKPSWSAILSTLLAPVDFLSDSASHSCKAVGIAACSCLLQLVACCCCCLYLCLVPAWQACGRVPGKTGVWVGDRKIGAVGVRITHGISSHGIALNVVTNLNHYK